MGFLAKLFFTLCFLGAAVSDNCHRNRLWLQWQFYRLPRSQMLGCWPPMFEMLFKTHSD